MKLSKQQREQVRLRYGGRCAYCGEVLGARWCADHREPVRREMRWVPEVGLRRTGRVQRPEHDHIGNLMPSCAPCNNYKHDHDLETFRRNLQGACGVLSRNQPTYRHAIRFGLVQETQAPIVFFFEKAAADHDHP